LPGEPSGTRLQIPSRPATPQPRQAAVQAVSQQKLSTQLPLTQSFRVSHVSPLMLLHARAPSQPRPPPHSPSGSVPASIGPQVPFEPVDNAALHASHVPSQAVSQQ
jgi:hypothetical protein